MIRVATIIVLAALLQLSAWAQTVTITGTVADPNGRAYQNGSGVVTLIPQNQQWLVNGTNPVNTPVPIAALDSFGKFSVSLTNTSLISPSTASPQWQFNFCSSTAVASPPICFSMTPMALTASQDISTTIQSQAALLPSLGGGGTPCLVANTVQYNAGGVFGCDTLLAYNAATHTLSAQNITLSGTLSIGTASGACGTASQCVSFYLSTGAVVPTPGQATLRFLAGGMACMVNGGAEATCGGGGGGSPPGSPLNSFQFNSSGSFGGATGFNYTPGAGINPGNVAGDKINNVITVTPDYSFTACPSGCGSTISPTTISAGANTITLTPVPIGVNGTDNPHVIKLSGISSPTEYVTITGGTAVGGAASGTITFNSFFAHASNPPTIASATTGIQEAFWSGTYPGTKVQLIPGAQYECDAPIYTLGNNSDLDGQWGTILDASYASCVVMGYQTGGWGTDSTSFTAMVHNLDIRPKQVNWNVAPTAPSTIPGNSPTATLTITTCPVSAFPGQLLWLAGTNAGVPTSFYGYGEFVLTTGGTCTVGVSGTLIIQQATPNNGGLNPNSTNLSTHGTGYTISNGVGAGIEDAASAHGHIYNVRFATGTAGGLFGNEIQIDNDQSNAIDNVTMNGLVTRKDAWFQGAGIFSPGPGTANGAISSIGPNVNISEPSKCVNWFSGNDIIFTGEIVCQNYTSGGATLSTKRGGFMAAALGEGIHYETGGGANPFSAPVGNPPVMVVGGTNKPIHGYTSNFQAPFSGGALSPWPTFISVGGATHTRYYYLVARNNTLTGCTSGGDCFSPPILIGIAKDNDPSINPVTVTWYGWGDNGSQPTAYDLLAVDDPTILVTFPAVPTGTGTFAVSTGNAPSSICNITNICTLTDNVAPGSLTSYTPVTALSSTKRYYPDSFLMPGVFAIAGDGTINRTTLPSSYIGVPTCMNGMEFLGGRYLAQFISHSSGSELDVPIFCPHILAPIAFQGPLGYCISSAGTCTNLSSGFVTIAPSATTVTVTSTAVTPWSRISIGNDDTTQGTALGVTCDTGSRTYHISGVVFWGSFTITSSAAPTNSACISFTVDNHS